jgi:VanZ family protein
MTLFLSELLDPLIEPSDRLRTLCLLLLATLVAVLLIGGHQPEVQSVLLPPPWDKAAHMVIYGGFAALAWVAAGARRRLPPMAVVLLIGLMDEAMQYYTPGRHADFADLVADLVGGGLAMIALVPLRRWRMARYPRK